MTKSVMTTWKQRYQAAHEANFTREYPVAYKDGHYFQPLYPKVNTANGLTLAITNWLNWSGHRAKRINSTGRLVDKITVTESGARFTDKVYSKSSIRGQADISATIFGRSVQLEIKAGRDKPSEYQLREQSKERAAGGIYEFIYSIEQFFEWYDRFVSEHDPQLKLL